MRQGIIKGQNFLNLHLLDRHQHWELVVEDVLAALENWLPFKDVNYVEWIW